MNAGKSDNTGIHLAIIPDGNRRWAQKNVLAPWKGHEKSAENFRAIADWCRIDSRIDTLTIWCFSTENWKRDPEEVEHLMKMLEKALADEGKKLRETNTRMCFSGRRDRLRPGLRALMESIERESSSHDGFTTNLALDYGGQDELLRAINSIDNDGEITDALLRAHLDHPELPDIDLVIRTSGEQRTSNFALWQSTYAEWIFHPKLFPDFTIDDLSECIDAFAKRTRRFGA